MRRMMAVGAILVMAVAMVTARQAPAATPQAPPPSDAQIAAEVAAVVKAWSDRGWWHGVVLVARGDTVLYRAASGVAQPSPLSANTPETQFNIATIAQLFTAATVLRLQDQGKLRVSDTVGTYMRSWPSSVQALTIEQLLVGQTGLTATMQIPAFARSVAQPRTTDALAALIVAAPVGPVPTSPRQTNSNFHLLAAIVEQVTGKPFMDVVKAEILTPLRLQRTGHHDGAVVPGRAVGLVRPSAALTAAAAYDMSNAIGHANMLSTVDDTFRFVRALVAGTLLGPESTSRMFTNRVPRRPNASERDFGYGYAVTLAPGANAYWDNTGAINGYASNLAYFPGSDITVLAMSNGGSGELNAILGACRRILEGRSAYRPAQRTAVPPREEDLAALSGAWHIGLNAMGPDGKPVVPRLSVRVDGQRVFVTSLMNPVETEWMSYGPRGFFSPLADLEIELPATPGTAGRYSFYGFGVDLTRAGS